MGCHKSRAVVSILANTWSADVRLKDRAQNRECKGPPQNVGKFDALEGRSKAGMRSWCPQSHKVSLMKEVMTDFEAEFLARVNTFEIQNIGKPTLGFVNELFHMNWSKKPISRTPKRVKKYPSQRKKTDLAICSSDFPAEKNWCSCHRKHAWE